MEDKIKTKLFNGRFNSDRLNKNNSFEITVNCYSDKKIDKINYKDHCYIINRLTALYREHIDKNCINLIDDKRNNMKEK